MSRLTRMTALIWPSHSVPAKLLPGLDHAGFVAGSTPLVGGLVYIERCDFVAQLGDSVMQGGLVGFDLSDQMDTTGSGMLECFF